MRKHEHALTAQLYTGLARYEQEQFPLPGIISHGARDVYIAQLIDSIRRVKFVSVTSQRDISPNRANWQNSMFDPIRAAILHKRQLNIDEACWFVFLFVHFGKHYASGYRYAREVYGALGNHAPWTFQNTRNNIAGFRTWLDNNEQIICRGSARGFGNHRKYQSLSAYKKNGTGEAFETYINWVSKFGTHQDVFATALSATQNNPEEAFNWLYNSMTAVSSFGRTARFDYLTMIGKIGLAPIKPGSPYLIGASGPAQGARLFFQGNRAIELTLDVLEGRIIALSKYLGVGLQEMEDSLCNWQKNPNRYRRFLA